MHSYSPELIQTMRVALDEVMTKIPVEQATPGIKAAVAECILKAAANGQTSYDDLIAAASEQIQTILSMLTSVLWRVHRQNAMHAFDFMEKRRAVLIGALGLTVGALSFWITLSLVDYGFWGVLHAVFP